MLTRLFHTDPFADFDGLRRQVDALLRDFNPDGSVPTRRRRQRMGWPNINVTDTGTEFVVMAELPGIAEDAITIEANHDSVTLSARRDVDAPEGYSTHRHERPALEFSRSFGFPAKIDLERITAKLDNGLLTMTLPRRAEDQPRRISVKVG